MGQAKQRKTSLAFMAFSITLLVWTVTFFGAYTLPSQVSKKTTSSFGECRNSNDLTYTRFHAGIDLSTNGLENTNIYATEEGYLWKIWVNHEDYGNAIYIMHADGIASVYGHLNRFSDRFLPVIQSAMIEFGKPPIWKSLSARMSTRFDGRDHRPLRPNWNGPRAPLSFRIHRRATRRVYQSALYSEGPIGSPLQDLKIERVRIDGEALSTSKTEPYTLLLRSRR